MNIDIVNKQVSVKQGLSEKKVALINKFYWRKVYDYFYSYDDHALNIDNVCVFYGDKGLIKKYIHIYIRKIRSVLVSKRFKPDSTIRFVYVESYKKIIRQLWNLRKKHKYTN